MFRSLSPGLWRIEGGIRILPVFVGTAAPRYGGGCLEGYGERSGDVSNLEDLRALLAAKVQETKEKLQLGGSWWLDGCGWSF